MAATSRSPPGERGLKFDSLLTDISEDSRSPPGERGLKWLTPSAIVPTTRRSPPGERGLKYFSDRAETEMFGRSPPGERGLKCRWWYDWRHTRPSLPFRGARIEIPGRCCPWIAGFVAPLTGSVD